MNKNNTRLIFGLMVWLLCFALLAWFEWPIKSATREIIFQPGELQLSLQNPDAGSHLPPQAFLEQRTVILEWIPIVRMGDSSKVKLSLLGSHISQSANSTDKYVPSSTLTNFKNVYESYSITVEARLELFDADVIPAGISGQVLPQGQDIAFTWRISPKRSDIYEGTAWLYLQFFPLGGGDVVDQAVSAQTLNIKVLSLLGIKSNYWRLLSVLGLAIGFFILKPNIMGIVSIYYGHKLAEKNNEKQKNW